MALQMRKVQAARNLEASLIRRSRTVAREWAEQIATWRQQAREAGAPDWLVEPTPPPISLPEGLPRGYLQIPEQIPTPTPPELERNSALASLLQQEVLARSVESSVRTVKHSTQNCRAALLLRSRRKCGRVGIGVASVAGRISGSGRSIRAGGGEGG